LVERWYEDGYNNNKRFKIEEFEIILKDNEKSKGDSNEGPNFGGKEFFIINPNGDEIDFGKTDKIFWKKEMDCSGERSLIW
jgi:hypothetical protein